MDVLSPSNPAAYPERARDAGQVRTHGSPIFERSPARAGSCHDCAARKTGECGSLPNRGLIGAG